MAKTLSHLEHHFAFLLWNVSMDDMCLLLDVLTQSQFVRITLCLAEDHRTTLTTAVHLQHGTNRRSTIVVAASDGQVLKT